jgi:hypothetical protein
MLHIGGIFNECDLFTSFINFHFIVQPENVDATYTNIHVRVFHAS